MSDKTRPIKGNSLSFSSLFSRNAKAKADLTPAPGGESRTTEASTIDSRTTDSRTSASGEGESARDLHSSTSEGIDLIVASHVFDVDWYCQQFQEGSCPGDNVAALIAHYLAEGAACGLNPHPLFDTSYYEGNNSDLNGVNPLVHFLQTGGNQGRNPLSKFDSSWYLRTYPDVAAAAINPLVHYITSGAAEGRHPCADFDSLWYQTYYLNSESEAVQKEKSSLRHLTALEHFVRFGVENHYATNKEEYRCMLDSDPALVGTRRVLEEAALPVFTSRPHINRINLIADRLPSDTSHPLASFLALGAHLASSTGAVLRVVTRKDRAQTSVWVKIIAQHSVPMPEKVEFVFCDYIDNLPELSVSARDVFIVSGLQNALSVRASIEAQRICYVISAHLDSSYDANQSPNFDFTTLAISSNDEFDSAQVNVTSELRRICESVFV